MGFLHNVSFSQGKSSLKTIAVVRCFTADTVKNQFSATDINKGGFLSLFLQPFTIINESIRLHYRTKTSLLPVN